MRIFLIIIISTFLGFSLTAQNIFSVENAPEKAMEYYNQGRELGKRNQYEKAIEAYLKALKETPNFLDASLYLADCYYALHQFEAAEPHFEKVVNLAPNYNPRVIYILGALEVRLGKYEEAIVHLKQFLKYPSQSETLQNKVQGLLENSEFAANAVKNPVPFNPKNLGAINTQHAEYLPSLTADGETMIYTKRIFGQEDFYTSTKVNGEWQAGVDLGEPINTQDNEGAQSISADGRILVYTVCNRQSDLGSCDLYISELKKGKWTTPKNMGYPINTRAWESQPSLSADGRTLYFTSSRGGGIGSRDIWVTYRKKNGQWLKPINLGETINTKKGDESPFIHADGQTLYFRSKGRIGMGGADLYFSKRQTDGTWGTPENLGYPINTSANEGSLIVSLDGATGYFASDKSDSKGATDLYSFEMPPSIRPKSVTYVKANVFDGISKDPLRAKIQVIQLSTGYVYTESFTNEKGGFLVCLPSGDDYALHVSKKGYIFYSENFALTEAHSVNDPILMEVPLQKLPPETIAATTTDPLVDKPISIAIGTKPTPNLKPVILKNIFFETGVADLKPSSKAELNYLKTLLTDNPTMKIQINGHTDNVGTESNNQNLSFKRAVAVVDYLIKQGIQNERLVAKGFGESQPISENETEAGRKANRRTEFLILER